MQNNSPIHGKEAASGMSQKVPLVGHFVVLSGRSKDSPRSPLTVRLGELHVKAGYVSTLLAGYTG